MEILPPRGQAGAQRRVTRIESAAGTGERPGNGTDGGRAGLPVATQRRERAASGTALPRSSAPLVAQLLAARMDLPQTRSRRRASTAEAEGAYDGARRLREAPVTARVVLV